MRRAATAAGCRDLVIVNSCGVTNEASRQARQAIRRLRREIPGRAIIVTGCAAEMEPDRFAAMPEIDGIVGNANKTAPATWRDAALVDSVGHDHAWRGGFGPAAPSSPLEEGTEDHTRAFLAVQNGCDHGCTFCAIPLGRGGSRSAPLADVVASAARCPSAVSARSCSPAST